MTELVPQSSDVVVALDIGTTKVCCLAGRKNEHGKLEIIERYIKYRVKSTFVSKKQVLEIAKSIEF